MSDVESSWENRMAALWGTFDDHAARQHVGRMANQIFREREVGTLARQTSPRA